MNKWSLVLLTVSGDGDLTARINVDDALFKEKVGTVIIQAAGYLE